MATTTIGSAEIKNHHIHGGAEIERTKIAQRVLAVHNIPLHNFRTWDALATNLPGTPANDDLGLVTGTLGTDPPYVGTGDLKTTTTTRYAGIILPLPPDYEDAQTVTIRCIAGMVTTISDNGAGTTIDVQAYRNEEDGSLSADLVTTAATTINSLTAANKDFVLTSTDLVKGDALMVRVAITITDAATATAVIGALWAFKLLADLR